MRTFDMDLHQILARHMPKRTWDPIKDALPNEAAAKAAEDKAETATSTRINFLDNTD